MYQSNTENTSLNLTAFSNFITIKALKMSLLPNKEAYKSF